MGSDQPRTGALLFDLDGTIADTLADIAASVSHVRELAGLAPLDVDRVAPMVGDGLPILLERALQGGRIGVDEALESFGKHHTDQCTRLVRLYPGAREHLDRWHACGRPLAVVTNKPELFARRILEHLGIAGLFSAVLGGDTTPSRKPSPEPLHAALEQLGASARDATMIGDGAQDIRAGKAAGLRTIGALYGFRSEAELRAEGADEYWVQFGVRAPALHAPPASRKQLP